MIFQFVLPFCLFPVTIVEGDPCTPTLDAIHDNCTAINDNTDPNTPHYVFQFSPCHTPLVHEIMPTMGSAAEVITIVGTGFSNTMCNNWVIVNDQDCTVMSANDTALTCQLAPSDADPLPVGLPLWVVVEVSNLGDALITVQEDLKRNFILLPHVSSVTPSEGSVAGGTDLNITGSGFYGGLGGVSVLLGGVACNVMNISYTQIICTTTASGSEMNVSVSVTDYSSGQPLVAECSGNCDFTFSSDASPSLDSVSPTTINTNPTLLTINGSMFGTDPATVQVKVGTASCAMNSVVDDQITCNTGNDVIAGPQTLKVVVQGRGAATSSLSDLQVDLVVSTINPSSGSENGGTLVTIDGLGFEPNNTSVEVDSGESCVVTQVDGENLTCIMPSGSGSSTITVTSNSQTDSSLTFTYSSANTPTVTAVNPTAGNQGDTITITGTTFGTVQQDIAITIGGVACATTSVADTELECTVGAHSAGQFPVEVLRSGMGYATSSTNFTYQLSISSVNPNQGTVNTCFLQTFASKVLLCCFVFRLQTE